MITLVDIATPQPQMDGERVILLLGVQTSMEEVETYRELLQGR